MATKERLGCCKISYLELGYIASFAQGFLDLHASSHDSKNVFYRVQKKKKKEHWNDKIEQTGGAKPCGGCAKESILPRFIHVFLVTASSPAVPHGYVLPREDGISDRDNRESMVVSVCKMTWCCGSCRHLCSL